MATISEAARAYQPYQGGLVNSNAGGGQAKPPYLQTRAIVTPKSMVAPGEAMGQPLSSPGQLTPKLGQPPQQSGGWMGGIGAKLSPPKAPGLQPQQPPPQASVPNPNAAPGGTSTQAGNPSPPQAGGNSLGDVYNFFKSDLDNERKQAMSGSIADAASRGVYYGTPLTGSEADINTQYLRGLGQLQSGMYGNEQSNQLARLGLATSLAGPMMQGVSPGGIDPSVYQMLGQLFGQSNTLSGQRGGPSVASLPNRAPAQLPPNTTHAVPGLRS